MSGAPINPGLEAWARRSGEQIAERFLAGMYGADRDEFLVREIERGGSLLRRLRAAATEGFRNRLDAMPADCREASR
jgi:hypothetical protein